MNRARPAVLPAELVNYWTKCLTGSITSPVSITTLGRCWGRWETREGCKCHQSALIRNWWRLDLEPLHCSFADRSGGQCPPARPCHKWTLRPVTIYAATISGRPHCTILWHLPSLGLLRPLKANMRWFSYLRFVWCSVRVMDTIYPIVID
jgi:hypothetical protein